MAQQGDLQEVGDRIEQLLGELSGDDRRMRDRAEQLVRLVVDLYGAGLERVLEIVWDTGPDGERALERLAEDELVASLLLVHGLHPVPLDVRLERAIEGVRPYLASHGGGVELLGVTDAGAVRLRMLGSCEGCPSSSLTLQLAVEGAISKAAPELAGIEVEGASTAPPQSLIPAASLSRRPAGPPEPDVPQRGQAEWTRVPDIADLPASGLRRVRVGDLDVLLCRVATNLYAYRDRCAACGSDLADGVLDGVLLGCPGCGSRFDVAHAGRGDRDSLHLDPLPLLERDGAIEVAVPAVVQA